ncbi:hypothetical protein [Pseudomonas sp. 5P_3.1_Bac2]|uniref:hypothetical protein n=1 Tax=Pseudomonas sp. 5P_3.1_Bac2 TaxID=2971617 RepID=UPI0021C812D0|nr:hypothetical protein [Pseudomonas sp. 5P_3.1_Bac2]MCU1718560.1 hypothetical protein [Pseudomonas sp. 5P_3.1_Bac2]
MRGQYKALIWAVLIALSAPLTQVTAEPGDIIISREVQPRTATRAPMVPDPNPLVSNPGAITHRVTTGELSDADFAAVATGAALSNTSAGSVLGGASTSTEPMQPQHMPGVASDHRAGNGGSSGASSNLSGQLNNRIQQGLRPLQQLGGQ